MKALAAPKKRLDLRHKKALAAPKKRLDLRHKKPLPNYVADLKRKQSTLSAQDRDLRNMKKKEKKKKKEHMTAAVDPKPLKYDEFQGNNIEGSKYDDVIWEAWRKYWIDKGMDERRIYWNKWAAMTKAHEDWESKKKKKKEEAVDSVSTGAAGDKEADAIDKESDAMCNYWVRWAAMSKEDSKKELMNAPFPWRGAVDGEEYSMNAPFPYSCKVPLDTTIADEDAYVDPDTLKLMADLKSVRHLN